MFKNISHWFLFTKKARYVIILYIIKYKKQIDIQQGGALLKKLFKYLLLLSALVGIWLIMNESVSVFYIAFGIAICIFAIYLSSKLLDIDFVNTFYIPPLKLLKYIFFMLYSIYLSGIKATYSILSGKISPNIVKNKIDSRITNKHLHNIIANSITLTPGTITLDSKNGELTVLCLHNEKNKRVCESFEPYMLEMQEAKEG